MKRFLICALVAALDLAGGMGLAWGQSGSPQPGSTSQTTKPGAPAAPGKDPPSKSPTQAKKGPPQADKKAPARPVRGDGCFDLFNTGKEMVNAYLMMLASHYAYLPGAGHDGPRQ